MKYSRNLNCVLLILRVRRYEILDITYRLTGGDAPYTGHQIMCTTYKWNML
ncbi:hypothetical protein QUB10_16410 [Microcoleus sp. B5-D4]|uniref:hypothetical protein n=1 Tax=Microcoleus sp. B5-D4 TaxID=2818681 RepID=UPI002FD250C9